MTARRIPLFDVQAQYVRHRADIDARLQSVLDHGGFILGPEVGELETALARKAGIDHAVTVGNGTDALLIALIEAGIGPGDAVFLPAFTFVATAGAVISAGARPVFCDVDRETFNLDPADLARRIEEFSGDARPRAVMAVDLFGQPAEYGRLKEIAAEHGMEVLSDAAQSFGAALEGAPVGSLAPVTATSFYPTKPLGAFGDGGALFTQDADRAARMRAIRAHGNDEMHGMNSRLDTMQASVLLAKLASFDADRSRRAEIAGHYDAQLSDYVALQKSRKGLTNAHAVYAVLSDRRDALRSMLSDKGIDSRAYYATPLHLTPPMRPYSEGRGSLPNTEWLSRRILALPIYAELSDHDVERVGREVRSCLQQRVAS
ncbi:DegT/DnrJ/EryC1/StrS aminotransferase family protein [Thalassococcus sp. S3]|uniref:DegT/DnrJ/EryC1/StrS family aminotransferase n=1 Tax=Thalassococcus sp. S3 TaxID=2017482 RepID=UPI001024167E|nr:DegT/DnrJ/EryC1/StrS family aminotransferase [Thalassococcus sp. S3]QBF32702.1 hypothetical protein CFI11_15985 [Thalassococcus sp. S3]